MIGDSKRPPSGKVMRVLIAEDDDTIRKLLVAVATKRGFQVHSCSDGAQALKIIQEKQFDLVITNFLMPRADGFQVLQTVLEKHPRTLVVVISGHAPSHVVAEAIRQGAHAFIRKPFKLKNLEQVLKEASERIRQPRN